MLRKLSFTWVDKVDLHGWHLARNCSRHIRNSFSFDAVSLRRWFVVQSSSSVMATSGRVISD